MRARAVATALLGLGVFAGCSGVSRDPLARTGAQGGNTGAVPGNSGMTTADTGGTGEAPTDGASNSTGADDATGGSALPDAGKSGAGRGGSSADVHQSGSGGETEGGDGDGVAAGASGTSFGSGGIAGVVSGNSGSGGDGGATAGKAGQGGGGSGGPKFELVTASGLAKATVECPADKPWVVGTGARGITKVGLQAVVPEPLDWPNAGTVRVAGGAGEATITMAYAVCSDASGTQILKTSSSNSSNSSNTYSDAECGTGMIAIGGGGECTGGGMLYRSRPIPDQPGLIPEGWRASCRTGAVTTYAICVTATEDFSDCHIERVGALGSAVVWCADDYTAVTAGGFCNANALFSMELDAELTKVNVVCAESTTQANAYAICCRW